MQPTGGVHWDQARALFLQALEEPPECRAAMVTAACGENVTLREDVLSLLACDADAGDFLERPAARRLATSSGHKADQRLQPGERLGRYEILAFLGAGAVSEVYRARDTRLGRTVALKLLTDPTAPDAGVWLLREAQHASTLNHAHICMVHEVDEGNGRPFIVLEYIEGTTLHALTRGGPLPLDAVLGWGAEIADALDHAHRRGVVHRDLKGSNVIVTTEQQVKVLDFGLARRIDAQVASPAASVLADASVTGTLTHMAPEVFRGGSADARVDIWALGVMLYEMASGTVPFRGSTPFATASAILEKPPAALPESVPATVREIITRCLSKEPSARFASAFEVGQALRVTRRGLTAAPMRRRFGRAAAAAVLFGVVFAGVAFLGWNMMEVGTLAVDPAARVLAVLPMRDAGGPEAQPFLADGMTEALIAELGRIDGLRVIGPQSMARLRGRADAVREAGRDTGSEHVLEGQVARADDRIRIAARLIHATSGRVLWSAEYDRHVRDVQALYGVIAGEVASAIEVDVNADDSRRLSLVRAVDPDVYEAYLKGRYYWNQRTSESIQTAIAHYEAAIRLDPSYAPAYAALADCYNQLGTQMVGGGSPREWRPRAAEAAVRALQIDPAIAEAHATLGYVRHYDWQWEAAEQSFRRAIALNPNYALARIWYANLLSGRGRVDEAMAQVTVAAEIDPLSPLIGTNVGWVLINAHRYAEAIAQLKPIVERDPAYVQAHSRLGAAYSFSGRHQEALTQLETAASLTGGRSADRAALAQGLGLAGRRQEAEHLLQQLLSERDRQYVPTGAIANVFAALGRTEEALRWLEESHAERTNNNAYLAVEPVYDGLRAEPRFQALLRATGLP